MNKIQNFILSLSIITLSLSITQAKQDFIKCINECKGHAKSCNQSCAISIDSATKARCTRGCSGRWIECTQNCNKFMSTGIPEGAME